MRRAQDRQVVQGVQAKLFEDRLRMAVRGYLIEALEDWNPAALPQMFDEVFAKHAVLRNDRQVEPFVKRGGLMFKSFEALQAAARVADELATAGIDDSVDDLRLEAQGGVVAARDALLQMQGALGQNHRGLQDLISSMGSLIAALDPNEYPDVPVADVGDMYDPL